MFFKNKKAQSAENDLLLLCSQYAPQSPITEPIKLTVEFAFPWRASEPLKRKALGRAPHTSRPDCSNIIKIIEDVLTKLGFWKDDSLIADLCVRKFWGDQVGITVRIEPINNQSI